MTGDIERPELPQGDPREILRHLHRDAIEVGGLSSRLARADIREMYHRALRAPNDG